MIHILKDKQGKFYRLIVTLKGTRFEEMDKSTQSHPRKETAINGALSVAGMVYNGQKMQIADHTKPPSVYVAAVYPPYMDKVKASDWLKYAPEEFSAEIKFVKTLPSKRK